MCADDLCNYVTMIRSDCGPSHKHTLCLDSLVMVGVDTNTVTLQVKGVLAKFGVAELILVEIWPAPNLSVDHVGEAFPTSHLCVYVCVCIECVCVCVY